jgi:hypothetical protein
LAAAMFPEKSCERIVWPARVASTRCVAHAIKHGVLPLRFVHFPPQAKLLYRAKIGRSGMKRYLIFAALGPFLGGFFLLVATTVMSGYWDQSSWAEVTKLFVVFLKTLQYSYLFGILPMLIIAAVDDIFVHVKKITPVVRMLLVGAIAFIATEFIYGSRGSDSGVTQFILYGLVGFVPATLSSWLAHEVIDKPAFA